MKKITILISLILLCWTVPVWSATQTIRYIDPSGADTGDCTDIGNPCKSMSYVDGLMDQNDITYARGGTYTDTTDYFKTAASGTASEPITFAAYTGETPIFRALGDNWSGSERRIFHIAHDYWVFDGLQLKPTASTTISHPIHLTGSYNVLKNLQLEGATISASNYSFDRFIYLDGGNYNEIYNSSFTKVADHNEQYCDSGYGIQVYGDYNRFHDNSLSLSGHDVMGPWNGGNYNEFFDNTVTNGVGYGIFANSGNSRNIFHHNNISGCGCPDGYAKGGVYIKGSYNITRYNSLWDNSRGTDHDTAGDNNYWYNNVSYANDEDGHHGWTGSTANIFYNNVYMKNMLVSGICPSAPDDYYANVVEGSTYSAKWENNFIIDWNGSSWVDDSACAVYADSNQKSVSSKESTDGDWQNNVYNYSDPKFVDADNGDFTIQAGSSLIDQGRDLTTTNGSGSSSSTLIVDDAGFFWYSAIDSTGDQIIINADTSKTATITAINYGTSTLTITPELSWSDGWSVNLYKSFSDSSTVLFSGSAPDIGAYEYESAATAPTISSATIVGGVIQ